MSETSFKSNYLKDKVIKEEQNQVLVQYGCSMCGAIFHSEQLCDDHISNCVDNTLNAEDPLRGTSNNRTRKRKLDQSVCKKESASLFDDSSYDESDDNEHECKKVKESDNLDLKDEDYTTLENPVYEATSHMISENEMLITLPYAQINDSTSGPVDFSNEVAIGFEQQTEEINYFEQEHKPCTSKDTEEEVIIENYDIDDYPNIYRDSTVKILSVFTTKPTQHDHEPKSIDTQISPKNSNSMNLKPIHTDNIANDSNKVLTVLSTVNVNKIDKSNEQEITVMDLLGLTAGARGEERIEIVEEVDFDGVKGKGEQRIEISQPRDEENDSDSLSSCHSSDTGSKKNIPNDKIEKKLSWTKTEKTNIVPNQKPKYSKIVPNDKVKLVKNNIIKKIVNQSTVHQKNRKTKPLKGKVKKTEKSSIVSNFKINQDFAYCYKEITLKEEEKEHIPSEFAVFDFYDEDDEKLKAKMEEDLEKEKALKKRTCRHCQEVFNDPMDVLRHKRKYHKFEKVFLTKEKLKPYFDQEDKRECPVCFLFLGPKGYKSTYDKHLMTHSDEYNFVCKICHMQFRRKDHWYNHESRHLNRPLVDKTKTD